MYVLIIDHINIHSTMIMLLMPPLRRTDTDSWFFFLSDFSRVLHELRQLQETTYTLVHRVAWKVLKDELKERPLGLSRLFRVSDIDDGVHASARLPVLLDDTDWTPCKRELLAVHPVVVARNSFSADTDISSVVIPCESLATLVASVARRARVCVTYLSRSLQLCALSACLHVGVFEKTVRDPSSFPPGPPPGVWRLIHCGL